VGAVFVAGSHAPSHGNGAKYLANRRPRDRVGRHYLKGREGDRINTVMAAGRLQLQSAPALA